MNAFAAAPLNFGYGGPERHVSKALAEIHEPGAREVEWRLGASRFQIRRRKRAPIAPPESRAAGAGALAF